MNTSSGHDSFYSNHTTLYLGHHYLQATYGLPMELLRILVILGAGYLAAI